MDSDIEDEQWDESRDESRPSCKYDDELDSERFLEQMETTLAFMTKTPDLSVFDSGVGSVTSVQVRRYLETCFESSSLCYVAVHIESPQTAVQIPGPAVAKDEHANTVSHLREGPTSSHG